MHIKYSRDLSALLLSSGTQDSPTNNGHNWKDYVLLAIVLLVVLSLAAYIFWFFCVREAGDFFGFKKSNI